MWPRITTGPQTPHLLLFTGAVCAALVVFIGLAFLFVPRTVGAARGPADPAVALLRTPDLERFALLAAVVVLAALLWPPEFWYHYPASFAPFLALVLAFAAGRIADVRPLPGVVAVAVVLVLSALHAAAIPASLPVITGTSAQIAEVDALVPAGSCVLTDDPEFTIEVNRFTARSTNSPQVVDSFGTTTPLSQNRTSPSGTANAASLWLTYFSHAQYLMLSQASSVRIVWTPALERYVYRHFVLLTQSPWMILKRTATVITGPPRYHVPPLLP